MSNMPQRDYTEQIISIAIADRRIAWACGLATADHLNPHDVSFDRNSVREVGYKDPERVSKSDLEGALMQVFADVKQACPKIKGIAIAVCTQVISATSQDRASPNSGYGRIAENFYFRAWSGLDVYRLALESFPSLESKIWVRPDTDFGAVGEHAKRLRDDRLASEDDLARYGEHYNKRNVLAFVKLSSDINIGISRGGRLRAGKRPPNVSMLQPRRIVCINPENNMVVQDQFPGVCGLHGDCYAGLISVSALVERLRYFSASDQSWTEADLMALPEGHPIWDVLASYTADLCLAIVGHHSPSLIVLSGRLVRDNLRPGLPNNRLLERIQFYFSQRVADWMVQYEDLTRNDGFIQIAYCNWPVLYGGLSFVARHLTEDNDNITYI